MIKETRIKSLIKSIAWRLMGVLILGVITYAYTRNWVQTSLITVLHHGIFLIVFYVHERVWLRIDVKSILKKRILKCITYETILGNVILGLITYFVTGQLKQMTQITLSYIGIKHIIYVLNEFAWKSK